MRDTKQQTREREAKRETHDDVGRMFAEVAKDIRRYVTGLCGNEQEAEDILQEVFVKAVVHVRRKGCVHGNPRHLLFHLARNTWVDYVRRSSARDRMLANFRERRPAFDVLRVDQSAGIHAVLTGFIGRADIPGRRRRFLKLRLIDGLSVRSIRDATGLSKPTIYRELGYGLRDLRKACREAGLAPEDLLFTGNCVQTQTGAEARK